MLRADIVEGFKKAGIARQYRAGEPIFLANEPSTGMYFIQKGEVKVVRRNEKGDQETVATMVAGQTMGEISLLLGQPHSATVIAQTDVDASLLTATKLEELRRDDPELALHLFEILSYTLAGHIMDQNRTIAGLRREIEILEKKLNEQSTSYSYF